MNFQKKKNGDFLNSRIFLKFKAFESVLLLFFGYKKKLLLEKINFYSDAVNFLYIYYLKSLFQIVIEILIGREK